MRPSVVFLCVLVASAAASTRIRSRDQLVSSVLLDCSDMTCVKEHVFNYFDTLLDLNTDARDIKNLDTAIFKRLGRVLKTHEFHMGLPETFFGGSEVVISPRTGIDVIENPADEARGVLKKKLLLPVLLLLKLKMKALMPIFVALVGIKAFKALILSKLAILIVLGFVVLQLIQKAGMKMPMSMMPMMPMMAEAPAPHPMYGPPAPMYGAPPAMSTPAPPPPPASSYDPSWDASPSQGGPYARVWSPESASSIAYSSYYQSGSTTSRP